jgi:hypothetical protein
VTYRSPAPNRDYVKVIHIPVPGMREIPDNQMIACAFTEDIDPATMSKGETFTVEVEPGSAGSFGSRTDITTFPDGTLVEFVVEATDTQGKALCRARTILIPRDAGTDIAIPVATASLLPNTQDQAVPGLNNRFEISQRGGDIGYKLAPFLHDKYSFSTGLGAFGGYLYGRMREDAAGDSVLRGTVAKDTPCLVRINRRILFR